MDIKEILKEKIESAKKELEVAKTQSTSEAVCFQAKVDAYYDCLTLIEQFERPTKVITIDSDDFGRRKEMKAYICCTKEKFHGKNLYIPDEFDCFPDDESSKPYFAKEPIIEENDRLANGSIVAECEVKEAFKIEFCGTSIKHPAYFFPSIHAKEVLGRSCLTEKQFTDYGKGKTLYAYHLENVKPVELDLYDFYEDEACTKPLTKAPQSYRFAYKFNEITSEDDDHYQLIKGEKVLVLSIHSQYCAKILNGEKDLEVRKTRIAEGVEYK